MDIKEEILPYIKDESEIKADIVEAKIDAFMIGFADWLSKLSPSQKVSVWSKDGQHSGIFTMDNEQLLERYKRMLKNGYLKQKEQQQQQQQEQ